jgi:uncharacterized protein (TIGR02284 family)
MQSSNEPAVRVLNSLIETTLDSATGYRDAADATENSQFQTLFSKKAAERLELSRRLQEEVRTFGRDPEQHQSTLGKVHNKFTELKGKITGGGDKSVIDEVERGEDTIKAKFENAMQDEDLPPAARVIVTSAYSTIKADHDEISALKHQMH